MANLTKRALSGLFESALRASGWKFLILPPTTAFPIRYHLLQGLEAIPARLYIWNISHGGGTKRKASEYRIQITSGVTQFQPEPGGRTLIMGWWDEVGVFAGFDYQHHADPLGSSPSIQVGEGAMRQAAVDGMAVHQRGNKEIVIAFRPEFAGAYVAQLEDLHRAGISKKEVALLNRIATDPNAVPDTEIAADVGTGARKRAMATVRRALRDYRFSRRILKAYGHRCAFCGVQMNLLDAAHILPVEHPRGVDTTANGVAVCTLHHRAYDNALITFDTKYKVLLNEGMARSLREADLGGGLEQFCAALRPTIHLPGVLADQPAPNLIREANRFRGW